MTNDERKATIKLKTIERGALVVRRCLKLSSRGVSLLAALIDGAKLDAGECWIKSSLNDDGHWLHGQKSYLIV
jgi:hypothetical protein